MPQNNERSVIEDRIGQEVVAGLENTLAWIKAQFAVMRSDVEFPKKRSFSAGASEYLN